MFAIISIYYVIIFIISFMYYIFIISFMYYLLKFIEVIERKKMLNCVMLFRNIFRIPLYYKKKNKAVRAIFI